MGSTLESVPANEKLRSWWCYYLLTPTCTFLNPDHMQRPLSKNFRPSRYCYGLTPVSKKCRCDAVLLWAHSNTRKYHFDAEALLALPHPGTSMIGNVLL